MWFPHDRYFISPGLTNKIVKSATENSVPTEGIIITIWTKLLGKKSKARLAAIAAEKAAESC